VNELFEGGLAFNSLLALTDSIELHRSCHNLIKPISPKIMRYRKNN